MTRLPPIALAKMSDAQKSAYEAILKSRGKVRGPLEAWLYRPQLAERAQWLGEYCRYHSILPPRLSELAILTIAKLWRSEFEWWAHKDIALRAGVDPAIIEAIRAGIEPVFAQEDEELVFAFVRSLSVDRAVGSELYRRGVRVLGQEGIVDLVGIAGYYTLISMTINVFDLPVPDGTSAGLDQTSWKNIRKAEGGLK